MRATRCPRLTSHPIPWPVPFPLHSTPFPGPVGRSVGRGAACRLSSVGRLCRVAQRAIALFSLACSTAQPCAPRSSLLFSAAHCPKTEEEEEKKDSEPRSHHPHPAQSIPEPTKGGFERKHTHHFFLICPREPTLNKVIDHLCHFAWGGLGEQNVSLSAAHRLDSRPPSSLSPHDSPGPSLGGVAFCKDPHRRQCVMRVCVRGMELGVKCHKGEVAATSTTPTGIMGW